MTSSEDEGYGGKPTIIIKRVVKGGGGHHGGAWKVAYADFVTAMMAFFLVMWILGQSEEVKDAIAGYYNDPVGFSDGGVPTPIEGSANSGEPSVIETLTPTKDAARVKETRQDELWRKQAEEIKEALNKIPGFHKYENQIELALTPDGLRISLIESTANPLYRIGGTDLSDEARQLLTTIAQEFRSSEHAMMIEGHTDARPFGNSAAMSNWRLSTERANSARNLIESIGIDPMRILEVRGYADRQLYNPLDPEDSRNRRVAITLLSDEARKERTKIPEITVLD